jgi:light-regulated signal transduction histidine kinase (bacteriophytochrome)
VETRREVNTYMDSGEEIWLDCRFTPFTSHDEPHLLLSVDDITDAKQAEVDLQVYAAKLEQSNRDLQEFAYIASHDLQEPLRKVLAFGDRLVKKYGEVIDETGQDYLNRMMDASQRMQTLINDLLTFSRVSTRAQPFAKVNLNELIGEVKSDLELQIDRTQGEVQAGNLPTIEADPTQMHQLLQNLIANALKFHQEDQPPIIEVSANNTRSRCQLLVKDNGIGFESQYVDRIFKPFQRLHTRQEYEGSGMGLAICRRIVERHGGTISATSVPGEGSTFIVTLPMRQPKGEKKHA